MSEKFLYVIFFVKKKEILEKEKLFFTPNFYERRKENIIRLYIMEDLTDTFYFRIYTKRNSGRKSSKFAGFTNQNILLSRILFKKSKKANPK